MNNSHLEMEKKKGAGSVHLHYRQGERPASGIPSHLIFRAEGEKKGGGNGGYFERINCMHARTHAFEKPSGKKREGEKIDYVMNINSLIIRNLD